MSEERTKFNSRLALKLAMAKKDMNASQLSDASGVGETLISNILNNSGNPTFNSWEKLAAGLGLTFIQLTNLGEED